MKLTKIPKKSEAEEQQYTRAVRKRLVQEDKEKEWRSEVRIYLTGRSSFGSEEQSEQSEVRNFLTNKNKDADE
jgi:hypothetical protein